MSSKKGASFLLWLAGFALLWGSSSALFLVKSAGQEAMGSFLQIYFFTCLDLLAIIVIFWKLFFSQRNNLQKKVELVLWFFFKLVCLLFLAITLKRLTNAPPAAVLLGVGFIGVGPLVAGMISNKTQRKEKR